eukprot:51411_1
MSSLKNRIQDMTFLELKREKERQITEVMESSDKNDLDSKEAEKALPKMFLKWTQFSIIFVYGIITTVALFALICYLMDLAASTFGGGFGEYMNYLLLTIVFLTWCGAILGCCLTFKYGTVSSNIARLQTQTHVLAEKVEGFAEVQKLLQDEVEELKSTLYGISVEKNGLLACVDKFDILSADLHSSGIMHDDFISECDNICDNLWKEYEEMKLATEKADLLKLFYDKQDLDDFDRGLNKNEFEYLLFDLDDEIKDKFPEFEEFDENHNGVIEIFEFENVMDRIYEKILQERIDKANRRTNEQYKQRQREQRREKIDKEKHKDKSYYNSRTFKFMVK